MLLEDSFGLKYISKFAWGFEAYIKQGNQRWQIPRPPHASAWQRSPH